MMVCFQVFGSIKTDDVEYEEGPQKWPKLQCRMQWHIQQLIVKYKPELWSIFAES